MINIINAAQENSPTPVTEALNRVLEILRTTELYSPQFNAEDDPHATDLVGGLMSVSLFAQAAEVCSCLPSQRLFELGSRSQAGHPCRLQ